MRRAVAIIAAFFMAACSSAGPDGGAEEGVTTVFEAKPTINLVVNNWTASALNVAVAEQLIERHLGYPVVPTRVDDTTEIYDGLADGTFDASLEIWPSDMTDRDRRYFERGEVLDVGQLGPVGKVGWFVPGYVIEADPALASWDGYQNASAVAPFVIPATAPNGRFLGTSPDYRQSDEAIIDDLGLPLEVVFSGSEEATLAELQASYDAREPILLYWWTPTAAVATFDLVNVTLPDASDYPEDLLFKATTPDLANRAPEVDAFLRSFSLTADDQLAMLGEVEGDGQSVADVAAAWIVANEDRWRVWIEPS